MISSALAGIVFDAFIIGNVVGVFWKILLLVVNCVQITLLWLQDHRARFTEEEEALIKAWFHAGTPGKRRLLLDIGRWETLPAGHALTEEGRRPAFLSYISAGRVFISSGTQRFMELGPGHFIGEMSLIGDGLASADVETGADTRVWMVEHEKLENLRVSQPDLYGMIEAAIARNLRAKLVDGNERTMAELG